MWEAMSRPLLPQLAKSFAEKLKTEIESELGASGAQAAAAVEAPSMRAASLGNWLRKLWQRCCARSRN
jgi:hypothetical protein